MARRKQAPKDLTGVPSRHPRAKPPATGSIAGDRQANAALYHIAPARCIAEGKTRREAIRCLKRYIAREIYQLLTTPPEPQPPAA
jgi:hypothetical protein